MVEEMATVSPRGIFVEFSHDDTDQSISERFEQQVCNYPGNLAIKTADQQLTYGELNLLANRLARFVLREVRDTRPVAILMEHGASAIIAVLAALKASRTFLCLDPGLPDIRIRQILGDFGSDSLITDNGSFRVAAELLEGRRTIVNMEDCDRGIDSNNLEIPTSPDSIAYVLYTSGSTGKPKGVMRTHRIDLCNIKHVTNTLKITHDDRLTLLGSYSTGQGMTDIFSALLNGAALFPRNLKADGFHGLGEWLVQERITFYHSAATVFRQFTNSLRGGEIFPHLRIIRLGAEAVSWKDIQSYKKCFTDICLLANELSCSEASTYSQFVINKQMTITEIVPVGYPVEGKEILILDENGNLLGPGAVGEIAVRSRFLSPGYWNNPDLTDLAFHQDKNDPGYRIYRTGDLGRKASDGCLEHLGRKDGQVQIRGYRVECREVELALLHDPVVEQAFVTHGQDDQDQAYLIAYVVCREDTRPTVSELRAQLSRRLPNFMLPAAFVFIDALPLTVTGKIDRGALPKPALARPPLDASYISPRNPIEKSIAAICSEILNISTIGVHDNLFDLGGHSISAMQIVNRVMKTFQIDIPMKCFYDSPTVGGLSALIASSRESEKGAVTFPQNTSNAPPLREAARPARILPSIAQEAMLRLERLFPDFHQFNVPTAYRLSGDLDVTALRQSLIRLGERHECLRTVFTEENGDDYQEILESVPVDFELLDLREFPIAERVSKARELFREESRRPFNLAHGPLFRVALFRLSDEDHVLAVTLHQLVSDGWSMRILLRDLAELYRSNLQGNRAQLPDLPIQFADFSLWQREALRSGLMDGQLSYWKNQLREPLTPLEFSETASRSDETDLFIARKEISISGKLYQSVKTLAREEKTTPYVILLTALTILLSRCLRQEDIRVGTLVANRHRKELENLIGHFVNTIIVRAKITASLSFRELAQQIKATTVSAYSNQDLPFEALLQSIEKDSTTRGDKLAPVLFIFQNEPEPVLLPKLTFSALEDFHKSSTPEVELTDFDLVISIKEGADGLTGFLVYKFFVFDETMIARLIQNFESLLEGIVDNPDRSVFALQSAIEI